MSQCEGRIGSVLREINGFPYTEPIRCGQVVGLTAIVSLDGETYHACSRHRVEVQRRIDMDDARRRVQHDHEEDAQESLRRRNDANEEMRMWGGKYAEWGR
jgi:hypothetical protein